MIRSIVSFFDNALFPRVCFICKQDGSTLCSTCLKSFEKSYDTPHPFITSVYSYKDKRIKKIIHAIKYFHRKDLLAPFSEVIAGEIKKSENYSSYILVPIPMPRLRKYLRGHNHSENLARMIGHAVSLPVQCDILKRSTIQSKKRQVATRSRAERLKNQKNVFIAPANLNNLRIILIDDVTTTGATLHEARRVLLAHGAASVMAFTIAH